MAIRSHRATVLLRAASVAAAFALAGCGARSTLGDLAAGRAGAGGAASTTTTTTAATTSGGGGGAGGAGGGVSQGGSPACTGVLAIVGSVASIAGAAEALSNPALVPLDAARSQVAVVFSGQPDEGPGGPMMRPIVEDVSIAPWGAWPPAGLDLVNPLLGTDTASFAVAPRAPGAFSLVAHASAQESPPAGPAGTLLAARVTPQGPVSSVFVDGFGGLSSFVAWHGDSALLGYQEPLGSQGFHLTLRTGASNGLPDVACGTSPLAAGAVAAGAGFLVATATSQTFPQCPLDGGADGPPSRLEILAVDGAGTPTLADTLDGPGSIGALQMTPRSKGAWVLFQRVGQDKGPEAIQAQRVRRSGHLAGAPFDAVPPGHATGPFAAAELGDGFALAFLEDVPGGTPSLGVLVFDATGTRLASNTVALPGMTPGAGMSLLTTQSPPQLLVAWTATPDQGGLFESRIQLARFGCFHKD